MHNNFLAVAFALVSAATMAAGTVWRHRIMRAGAPEGENNDSPMRSIKQPAWWASMGLAFVAYGFQAAAPGEASGAIAPAQMGKQEALKKFTVDLTEQARSGKMDPIVGRDDEIRQMVDILMRRRQNNPIMIGEAGVGKTEVAKALATVHATELIRLQCYEGLDQAQALYEWNYQRQLLAIEAHRGHADGIEDQIFSEKYLLERPLLAAIRRAKSPVLLIDEIDRADDDFEAFLLELLADASVTIPELGTVTASHPPIIVLTSNRTRDLHDAVKRRCLYRWIDYPTPEREVEIVRRRVPDASQALAVEVASAVAQMRDSDVQKPPGVAETLDFAAALLGLGVRDLPAEPAAVADTLLCLLKTHEDQRAISREVAERLLGKVA